MDPNMVVLMQLYEAIFQSKLQNTDITQVTISNPRIVNQAVSGRWFSNGTLRGFDVDINDNGTIRQIRILEQNPNKLDAAGNLKHYANLARQGHRICWVIDRNGSFLGRIQDGQWHFSQPRATTPVQAPTTVVNNQAVGASQPDPMNWDTEMVPDIPDHVGIPDAVLNHFANLDEEPPDDMD